MLLSLGYSAAGWAGLALLRAVLIGLVVGIVFWTARRWLSVRPAAALALVSFVVGIGSLALRAQLFGIVCFVLVIALLADRRRHPRLVLLVPLVLVAWANLHGSFFLGVGAAALALLADLHQPDATRLRSASVLALSAVASVVTPFGAGSWSYALGLSTNADVARLVTEWQRTSPLTFDGALFYLTVLAAAFVLAAARRREGRWPPLPSLVWLAGLVVVGAWAERGVVWWAFGAPIVLAPMLAGLVARDRPANARPEPAALRRLNLGIGVVLALVVVVLQPIWRPSATLAGPAGLLTDAPVGLATALREHGHRPPTAPWSHSAGRPGSNGRRPASQSWWTAGSRSSPRRPGRTTSRSRRAGPARSRPSRISARRWSVVDRRDQPALLDALEDPSSGWGRRR